MYTNALVNALRSLFHRTDYNSAQLLRLHEELIASGHISPLNEFYRSANDALRVTLDHCITYEDLIKWTLSLFQTSSKPHVLAFAHDLYSIAIDLDLSLVDRIDLGRCATDLQEHLKSELQTLTENHLRGQPSSLAACARHCCAEMNSYLNASPLEKLVTITKKLNVTTKDRMVSDLNTLVLHLIQASHGFEPNYRPMQIRIRVSQPPLPFARLIPSSGDRCTLQISGRGEARSSHRRDRKAPCQSTLGDSRRSQPTHA